MKKNEFDFREVTRNFLTGKGDGRIIEESVEIQTSEGESLFHIDRGSLDGLISESKINLIEERVQYLLVLEMLNEKFSDLLSEADGKRKQRFFPLKGGLTPEIIRSGRGKSRDVVKSGDMLFGKDPHKRKVSAELWKNRAGGQVYLLIVGPGIKEMGFEVAPSEIDGVSAEIIEPGKGIS